MEKEKSNKIQMVYGYSVCLVAVIAFLISITTLVSSVMDLSDPINSYRNFSGKAASLASYENYKMDIIKSIDPARDIDLDDTTLHAMYDAAYQDAISKVKHNAFRSVIVSSLVLLICIVLFVTHWMWMRRLSAKTE